MIYPHKKIGASAIVFFLTISQNPYLSHSNGNNRLADYKNSMDMRRLMMLLTGSLVVILSGCTKYEIPKPECPENLPAGVSFSADVQPIFDQNCVMCHGGGQSPNLSLGWSYDELTAGGYLDTDFPCSSLIYETLTGTHQGRASDEDILTILGWINEGAEDN
jgi:hypothetical protein